MTPLQKRQARHLACAVSRLTTESIRRDLSLLFCAIRATLLVLDMKMFLSKYFGTRGTVGTQGHLGHVGHLGHGMRPVSSRFNDTYKNGGRPFDWKTVTICNDLYYKLLQIITGR